MIEAAVAWLRESVPADWSVGPASRAGASSSEGVEADAAVDVTASNGTGTTIVMEAKRTFEPRDAERLLGGIGRTLRALSAHIPILVVAPWLSERSRSLLREEGINYFDLSGNAELKLDHPALYIKMTGAAKDPTRATRNKARGQGKKAGRLIRILADTQPPYRVTDLAEASDLAPGYVSRLLEAFSDEALIDRSGRGAVEAVDVAGLLRRWVETYDVLTTNYSTPFLAAAGAKATLQRLPDLSTRFAVTGSFAAVRLAPVAGPALLAVYCDNTDSVAASLSLVPTDSGANVVLLKPFDPVVWTGLAFDDAGIAYCAPSQVAVDCLTGNGRMPAEGEAVLEWMSKNELAWRRPTLSTSQDQ